MERAPPLLLAAVLAAPGFAQTRWYVDDSATGANDGSGWTDAYTDLAVALATAASGDEIWVAAGTYLPSQTGDRLESFLPKGGQTLYGGFAGTESALADRAGLFDQTVLSGDLLGNDGPGFANRADNSEHVLSTELASGVTTIDGFTIRGGHATVSPGGGAYYSPDAGLSQFEVRRCRFQDNDARGAGGAIWCGGYVLNGFEDCAIVGNRAGTGGAAFQENGVTGAGFARCRLVGNVATREGGGALAGGWYSVVDCLIIGNRADGTSEGGGALLGSGDFLHCTVYANRALGGPLVGGFRGATNTKASILWGNVDDRGAIAESQHRNDFAGWRRIEGCCVQGWYPALGGPDAVSGDPEFLDPLGPDGIAGTEDDDLRLGLLSPCIDILPVWPYVFVDFLDRPRAVETRACSSGVRDLGAYERQVPTDAPHFCPATASSLGLPARIDLPCLLELDGGPVDVVVDPVPDGIGWLVMGDTRTEVPFGNGFLCVGGQVRAFAPAAVQGNALHVPFDPATAGGGAIVAGTTWNLQAVYRDPAAGGARANASDAIAVTVLR